MHRSRPGSPLRLSLAWLLGLALLLPIAQSAASWHAISHLAADAAGGGNDRSLPGLSHCDLCLNFAAIGGGALPSTPQPLVLPAPARPPAPDAVVGRWLSLPALAYLSRAPPVSPR